MMNQRESTAYHEAGHAVVAWLCHCAIGVVTIKSDGTFSGSVQQSEYGNGPSLVDGYFWCNGPDDYTLELTDGTMRRPTAIELQLYNFSSELYERFTSEEIEVLVTAAGEVAQKKADPDGFHPYHSSKDWEDVYETLEHLGDGARDRLYKSTEDLLNDPIVWVTVDALAKELLARETMSGDDAIGVMRQAIEHHLIEKQ